MKRGAAGERSAAALLLLVWALLLAALLSRHEMWRDELQAWLLARDSGSLVELWRNSRYEGHPLAWHALLLPVAHAGASPAAMQAVHWAIAVGAAAVLLFAAPFPLLVRAALVFSYLPLFEYGVISRNYALSVLGLWLAAWSVTRGSPACAAAAAGLAANASPMGFLAALGVGGAIAGGGIRRAWGPLALLLGFLGLAALQMAPAADYEHARGVVTALEPLRLEYLARGFAAALLPLPPAGFHFWGSSWLFPWPPGAGLARAAISSAAALVVIGALIGLAVAVRRCRPALLGWLIGASALLSFAYLKFPGAIRHQGFLWLWAVAVLWIAVGGGALGRRTASWLLAPGLAVGLGGAAIAGFWELRAPFAAAACVAAGLEQRGLDRLPLVGGVDWATAGVVAYLPQARVYYPASRSEGSYVVWNLDRIRQERLGEEDLVGAALERDRGEGAVLLVNRPLERPGPCEEAFSCAPVVVADEALWVYHCRRRAPAHVPFEASRERP